ncbi:MAG TPA: glycosyltransferase family 87 protein [Stellaceae bacterium]
MSSGDPTTPRFAAPFGQSDAAAPTRGGTPGRPLSPRQALVLAAICGAFGIIAWGFYLWAFHGDPGQDWMVFYTAARAYFDGNLPLIFDGESLTAALNQRFAGWLAFTLNLHPWVYPPTFLLLFLPFGVLPPAASLAVFLLSGFIVLLAAAALYAGSGQPRWITLFSLVLCPAVPFNVMTGQNAFFTSALLVGGFGLIGRYPVLGGALLGILSFKPQLWLMVPVALLAARQWRALGGAAASAFILALVSLVVFGPEIWRAWIGLVTGMDEAYSAWVTNGRLNGMSVFACLTWLGAPRGIANLGQALAIAVAAAIVYWVFRRPAPGALQLAVLLAATMLAAPHASASDAVLLALETSLYVVAPGRGVLRPSQLALAAALWISPLFNPPSVFRPGSLTPLLILLLLGAIIVEIRDAEILGRRAPAG